MFGIHGKYYMINAQTARVSTYGIEYLPQQLLLHPYSPLREGRPDLSGRGVFDNQSFLTHP